MIENLVLVAIIFMVFIFFFSLAKSAKARDAKNCKTCKNKLVCTQVYWWKEALIKSGRDCVDWEER